MSLDQTVRSNVRRITDMPGLEELSRKMGMGSTGILSYLQQERSWSLEEVETVAKYLGVNALTLLTPDDGRKAGEPQIAPVDSKILEKEILTTGQIAKICKVAPRTVSKWFDSGRLKGYRVPGSQDRRIPKSYLIDFLVAHNMPLCGLDPKGGSKPY